MLEGPADAQHHGNISEAQEQTCRQRGRGPCRPLALALIARCCPSVWEQQLPLLTPFLTLPWRIPTCKGPSRARPAHPGGPGSLRSPRGSPKAPRAPQDVGMLQLWDLL